MVLISIHRAFVDHLLRLSTKHSMGNKDDANMNSCLSEVLCLGEEIQLALILIEAE